MDALTCSQNLSQVLSKAYSVLAELLAATCAPVCVSKLGQLLEFDRTAAQVPVGLLEQEEGPATEDFVRIAVVRQSNLMLSDIHLSSCKELQCSLLLEQRRELDIPLEQAMAVMLEVGRDWQGGFMLYRDGQHPFSERDRALLQRVAPALAKTVRHCRKPAEQRGSRWMLESLLRQRGFECVVVDPHGVQIMSTERAEELLKTWFPASQLKTQDLPLELAQHLAAVATHVQPVPPEQRTYETPGSGRKLKVSFIPLEAHAGRRLWALMLQEQPYIPAAWKLKLTKRELEVVACLLLGWDNRTIADELKCSVDTVKKHLQHIFDKLGVDQRSQVLHQATQL